MEWREREYGVEGEVGGKLERSGAQGDVWKEMERRKKWGKKWRKVEMRVATVQGEGQHDVRYDVTTDTKPGSVGGKRSIVGCEHVIKQS